MHEIVLDYFYAPTLTHFISAMWSGHKYVDRSSGNPIDVDNVFKEVVDIINEIDVNEY
jgi:hypothetical protein